MVETTGVKSKKPGNINDWARALYEIKPELAKCLDENRITHMDEATKMGLRTYQMLIKLFGYLDLELTTCWSRKL